MLRCSIAQIVPIDGQHAVADTQLPVTCSQSTLQQVEDVDSVLLWPPHQLDAQLFLRSAFIQDHMDAVISQRLMGQAVRRVAPGDIVAVAVRVAVRMRAVAMALFSEHSQPEELAGLFEGGHSKAVRYVANVNAIDLRGGTRSFKRGLFFFTRFLLFN